MLLERPLGFGPLQFRYVFSGEDPHNVFINAFASYGWLGGFAFFALNAMTMYVGWWLALRRGPLQPQAIALWSCLFVQLVQGFQIDTDHWRHFYLLMGIVWGLMASDQRVVRKSRITRKAAVAPPASRPNRIVARRQ